MSKSLSYLMAVAYCVLLGGVAAGWHPSRGLTALMFLSLAAHSVREALS